MNEKQREMNEITHPENAATPRE